MIFHNLESLISVGAEVTDDGDVFVALAACNRKDQPARKWANKVLHERLKGARSSHREFMGTYDGNDIGADVFGPIRDSVRKLNRRRNVDSVKTRIKENLHKVTKAWLQDKKQQAGFGSCCSG
jgi:hypothetical protein